MADAVNGNDDELAIEDKIASVMQIVETLNYPELLRLRDLIAEEYKQKVAVARESVIAEMQTKLQQLDMSLDDVIAAQQKRKRRRSQVVPPRYLSPEGKTWSGRGPSPKWIRELEEAGGNREDYLIKEEG
jgi:DNA-binding protein H-NS